MHHTLVTNGDALHHVVLLQAVAPHVGRIKEEPCNHGHCHYREGNAHHIVQ